MSSTRNSFFHFQGTTSTSDNVKESLLVWFLRFFTSVPWGLLPITNLVDFADKCYMSFIFSCFPFCCFSSTRKLKNYFFLSSFCSPLCFFLLYLVFLSNLLFFYFTLPITLFCLLLPYVLLLFNLFSFYYLSFFKVLYVIPIFMASLGFIGPP